jgi:putative MATE family efflux protein
MPIIQTVSQKRDFLRVFAGLALPMALQNLLSSALNMTDMLIVGQLGTLPIAAVSLANRFFMLLNIFHFGLSCGTSVLAAQFWGNRDVSSIRKTLGAALVLTTAVSLLFTAGGVLFPAQILGLFSKDRALIEAGSGFLSLMALCCVFAGITSCYTAALRSTGKVRFPVCINVFALACNTGLNYLLVFGKLGFPAMGVAGSALATVISRVLECALLLLYAYGTRQSTAGSVRQMLDFSRRFLLRFVKTVLPVVTDEFFWGLSVMVQTFVYAQVGTSALAAANIAQNLEMLAVSAFLGISYASGILIGNRIGEGRLAEAKILAKNSLVFGFCLGFAFAAGFFFLKDALVPLFKIAPAEMGMAREVFTVIACFMPLRVTYMILITGVLRSGGNTLRSMLIDSGVSWAVGVPLAVVAGLILRLPVYMITVGISLDYFVKTGLGLKLLGSGRWIKDLTGRQSGQGEAGMQKCPG